MTTEIKSIESLKIISTDNHKDSRQFSMKLCIDDEDESKSDSCLEIDNRSTSLPNLTTCNESYSEIACSYIPSGKLDCTNSSDRLHVPSPLCSPENEENSKLLGNSADELSFNLGLSCEDCHLLARSTPHKSSSAELESSSSCDNIPLHVCNDNNDSENVDSKHDGGSCSSAGNGCEYNCDTVSKPDQQTTVPGLTLKVNPENSRLSTVLENIPLVYIPHTRVLSVQSDQSSVQSSLSSSDAVSSSAVCTSSDNDNVNFDCAELDETVSNLSLSETPPKDIIGQNYAAGGGASSACAADDVSHSSMSSISLGTDLSLPAGTSEDPTKAEMTSIDLNDDVSVSGFYEINLHSRNTFDKAMPNSSSIDSGIEESSLQTKGKRKAISSFLAKNIFSRKSKDQSKINEPSSPLGWKLFGKVPPKTAPPKDPAQISEEYQAKQRLQMLSPNHCRKKDLEVLSTTALILENRPMNLPSKSPEEELRHRLEYEAMVEAAKKKEIKELKRKKKQMQQQLRVEDQLAASLQIWNNEILPNWENMRESKKARDLWWQGIPPSVRGKVWKLAIGNDLNLTHELYEICLGRAQDYLKLLQQCCENGEDFLCTSKEASVDVIRLDVSRTFPQLKVFQKGGPYYDMLHSLLGAYTSYRPDVGYVQGMSFLAAVLMLNMDVADAFICFANLLNKPCQVAFFRIDETLMKAYFQAYEVFFQENLPKLYGHFQKYNLTPDLYIIDWIFTLYSKSLPLDVASRVWDVFCRDGEEFLFRTALGILKMFEGILYNLDFIHLAQFLTKLPEKISAELLFKNIDCIKMQIDKRKFCQVLSSKKDQLLLEKERESIDGAT